jgi:acyl-coenzyme A synthetase/AMP-(fatty) acid ligase
MTHWIIHGFENYAEQIYIVYKNGTYSYQDLQQQVSDYCALLQDQLDSGCVVVILSDYSFYSIALLLACIELNTIIVPVVSTNKQEDDDKISTCGAQFILNVKKSSLSIKTLGAIKKVENGLYQTIRDKQHSGLVLFSSGSTGQPKAMLHDLTVLLDSYQNKRAKKIAIMIFLLFDHIGGINTLFNCLSMGAKAVLPAQRTADAIAKLIEQEQVRILPASPTFLNSLLLSDVLNRYDLSSLRMITYGTETMPESLLQRVKASFPRVKLLQTFGTSETGIAQVTSRSSRSLDIKIDDPNTEYKIIDGELWLKSQTQIIGYLNASMVSFSNDGWFCTGDLVEQSDDGYLKIIGRTKEVINVGGEKVLPIEVESFLLSIEGVNDCLVYAKSNAITGQAVAVDIVSDKSVDKKLLKQTVRKQCFTHLARFKIPTKIHFVEQLCVGNRFKKMRLHS